MTNLYYLPSEIKDIILKEYWYDYFKRSIINELNDYTIKFDKLKIFMNNHFYKCRSQIYDKQLVHYYKQYNEFLKNISRDKSISLYLLNNYPCIKHIIRSEYLTACYNDINDDLKYICLYAVINGNPYMSYYNKQRFIDMLK